MIRPQNTLIERLNQVSGMKDYKMDTNITLNEFLNDLYSDHAIYNDDVDQKYFYFCDLSLVEQDRLVGLLLKEQEEPYSFLYYHDDEELLNDFKEALAKYFLLQDNKSSLVLLMLLRKLARTYLADSAQERIDTLCNDKHVAYMEDHDMVRAQYSDNGETYWRSR